ncbi:hypothetical protein KY342_05660 [Candidatus Woesearchaeota archaeon]|nr:hypothetical protein [Candidatus Woesearchaeota archaeon]
MAKRRKTENATELYEFLIQRVDRRTDWGKEAWKTIEKYDKANDTSKLSLLKGLSIEFPERSFVEVLNVDPVDYQRNVKARCVCGQGLSKEAYRMRIRGVSRKGGMESQVHGKIRDKVPVSGVTRKSNVEFLLGKDCYAHFPDLLSDFGYKDMKKTVKEGKKRKRKELEEMVDNVSAEVEEALRRYKIDPEQFRQISELMKESKVFSDKNVLFELDPGKKNSFANWFREGIKEKSIKNKEIVDAYYKLENAAHLLTKEELSALTTYSYEYRQLETRAVIGGIKDDLLYLDGLSSSDPLIKRFGRLNLDQHYVRPGTRFRSRNKLEKATIRDKLKQSHLTFLEGLGIKLHFPDIENTRLEANRELAQRYGVGRSWNYLLKEVFDSPDSDEGEAKSFYDEVKDELAADYRKHQRIVNPPDLTKGDYLALKSFEKRSKMGRRTERENYLRMFSIRGFRDIAPIIIEIGRKVRYARRKFAKTEDELLKGAIIKQKYFLREHLEESFQTLTGIEESPTKVIDMIVNAQGVENEAFQKFQKSHAETLREAYDNGLLAIKYLNHLARNFERLQKEEVVELDEKTIERLAKIEEYSKSDFINIKYIEGKPEERLKEVEVRDKMYVPKRFFGVINRVYNDLERVLKHTKLEEKDFAQIKKNKAKLEAKGKVLYVEDDGGRLKDTTYSSDMGVTPESIEKAEYMRKRIKLSFVRKRKGYKIRAVNVERIEKAVKDIEAGVEVDEEFLKRLNSLNIGNLRLIDEKRFDIPSNLGYGKKYFDRVVFSKGLKERIDNIYDKIQKYKDNPLYATAEKRRETWEKEYSGSRWQLSRDLREEIYNKIVKDDKELQMLINGLVGGWLNHGILKRTHSYRSRNLYKFDLTFSRFMSNGEKLRSDRLASGDDVEFKVHENIYRNFDQDLKASNIDQGQYEEGLKRIKKFEQDVNNLLLEKYLRKP